jgi:hypothetical protein
VPYLLQAAHAGKSAPVRREPPVLELPLAGCTSTTATSHRLDLQAEHLWISITPHVMSSTEYAPKFAPFLGMVKQLQSPNISSNHPLTYRYRPVLPSQYVHYAHHFLRCERMYTNNIARR